MADADFDIEQANATLVLEEVRWRRIDQSDRHESLNRRLTTLFALNFALLAVLSASLQVGGSQLPDYIDYMIYSTIAILVLNIVLLLWAYRVGQISRRPALGELFEIGRGSYHSAVTMLWIAREINLALQASETRMDAKSALISRAMLSSTLAVILVAAIAALTLETG